jgi:CheY-like chemotaxis protein
MSHEIRTPLNAILGYTDILIEESWGRAIVKNLQIIKRNGESLLHIVSDILDLSKIEAEKVDLELISCSALHLIEDVASLMKVQADAKGLEFQVDYVGPIPERIRTDPTRLRQILINLLGNAIKFTERGSVRLVAELAEDRTRRPTMTFGVVDTGIGMSEEELAKVFQPFVQADGSTARRFGGTGLGLVISKRLAQILGGDITVWCAPRAGSTFCLWIPTGPLDGVSMIDVSHRAEVAPRDVAEETQRPVAAADLRILLAEDCPDNQRLISYFLRKTGADVTIAENGRMAVDLALAARDQDTSFDLILMDMQMPEMDGYQATTELRAAEYNGPIIALTAHAMSGDREKCIQAGCDDYVEKPISREKLIAAVAANSRKTAPRIRAQSTGGHPPNG